MYSDNDPRENFLNNTFIKYIGFVDNFIIGLVIFDRNEPRDNLSRNKENWPGYDTTKFSARMNIQKGIVRSVEFENDNKKVRALNIARHYRPGIGRRDSALYASLILNFYNRDIESSPLKNLRLPAIINELDNLIKDEILVAFFERHNIYTGTTNHDKPRFITIPYSTEIKTSPL